MLYNYIVILVDIAYTFTLNKSLYHDGFKKTFNDRRRPLRLQLSSGLIPQGLLIKEFLAQQLVNELSDSRGIFTVVVLLYRKGT